jgi:hypothetical protein
VGSGLWTTVDSGYKWGFGRLNQLLDFFDSIEFNKSKKHENPTIINSLFAKITFTLID